MLLWQIIVSRLWWNELDWNSIATWSRNTILLLLLLLFRVIVRAAFVPVSPDWILIEFRRGVSFIGRGWRRRRPWRPSVSIPWNQSESDRMVQRQSTVVSEVLFTPPPVPSLLPSFFFQVSFHIGRLWVARWTEESDRSISLIGLDWIGLDLMDYWKKWRTGGALLRATGAGQVAPMGRIPAVRIIDGSQHFPLTRVVDSIWKPAGAGSAAIVILTEKRRAMGMINELYRFQRPATCWCWLKPAAHLNNAMNNSLMLQISDQSPVVIVSSGWMGRVPSSCTAFTKFESSSTHDESLSGNQWALGWGQLAADICIRRSKLNPVPLNMLIREGDQGGRGPWAFTRNAPPTGAVTSHLLVEPRRALLGLLRFHRRRRNTGLLRHRRRRRRVDAADAGHLRHHSASRVSSFSTSFPYFPYSSYF